MYASSPRLLLPAFALTVAALSMPTSPATAAMPENQICAQSIATGRRHCEPVSHGPAAVWDRAVKDGGLPIQMFVDLPPGVTPTQFAKDAQAVAKWSADIDGVMKFVGEVKRNAESYRASLQRMRSRIEDVRNEQNQIMGPALNDPAKAFRDQIYAKERAARQPLLAELASDKDNYAAVGAAVAQLKVKLTPLSTSYLTLVGRYRAYHDSEGAAAQALAAIRKDASAADEQTLPAVEARLADFERAESAAADALIIDDTRLLAEYEYFAAESEKALAPFADFLATHGAVKVDMGSGAQSSLAAMTSYCEMRKSRIDAAILGLSDGMRLRRQALIDGHADAATRSTLAQAKSLAASAQFLADATGRIEELWKWPALSTKLRLPYLGAQIDKVHTFLQMEAFCADTGDTLAWKQAGCLALGRHFTAARTYENTSIGATMRMGAARLRSAQVAPALLDTVDARLSANDLRGAAAAYDAALAESDK